MSATATHLRPLHASQEDTKVGAAARTPTRGRRSAPATARRPPQPALLLRSVGSVAHSPSAAMRRRRTDLGKRTHLRLWQARRANIDYMQNGAEMDRRTEILMLQIHAPSSLPALSLTPVLYLCWAHHHHPGHALDFCWTAGCGPRQMARGVRPHLHLAVASRVLCHELLRQERRLLELVSRSRRALVD